MTNSCYHPDWNPYGTYKDSADKFWYESTLLNSVADCFKPANIGTVNGRPDGKTDTNIYKDQFIDCREFSFNFTEQQMKDRVKELELEQISGDVVTIGILSGLRVRCGDAGTSVNIDNSSVAQTGLTGILQATVNSIVFKVDIVDGYVEDSAFRSACIAEGASYTWILPSVSWALVVKQNTHLSQGTRLHTTRHGNTTRWPATALSRLSEGKSLIGYPLLVNQDGTDSIPDGTTNLNIIFDEKYTNGINRVYSDNLGTSYGEQPWSALVNYENATGNGFYSIPEPTNRYQLFNYTAQNTTQSSATKQVIDVEPKVIATNSHSIYKGSAIGNCIGKVLVGSDSNGLESEHLGNIQTKGALCDDTGTQNYNNFPVGEFLLCTGVNIAGIEGHYYYRVSPGNPIPRTTPLDDETYWLDYGSSPITTQPSHKTLQLDNSTSTAVKYFNATSVENRDVFVSRFLEEMVWDYDLDGFDDVVTISAGVAFNYTASDSSPKIITFSGFDNDTFNGKLFITKNSWSATLNADYLADKYIKDGALYIYPDTLWTRFEPFNGNGFGDNNKFNQLTNGTETDLNGNTISTKVINQFTGFKHKGGN
jgi:hypothetical protein